MKDLTTTILVVGLSILFVFGIGYVGVQYTSTIGKAQQNAEHEVFKNGNAYIDGTVQSLTDRYMEYQRSDEAGKEAIKTIVVTLHGDFDSKHIKNAAIREWYLNMFH